VTFTEAALQRLDRLWRALYGEACPERPRALAKRMLAPWGDAPIPRQPPWRSDIGDDHSPFEYSVAFGAPPELRLLVEGQGESLRAAGLALHRALGAEGAHLEPAARVEELLLPELADPPLFYLWHSVALRSERTKVYFNPSVRGAGRAPALMREAMERLGMAEAWRGFAAAQAALGTHAVFLFCLDLEDGPSARVKLYAQPEGRTAEELARVAGRDEIAEFCRAMTGSDGPYRYSPTVTRLPSLYFAYLRNQATPSEIAIQVPIRHYVPDDRIARDRIVAWFERRGLDAAPYERALDAVARRRLDEGRGLNAWVSLQSGSGLITVYFAAELYRALPPQPQ
jgi:DMATS type aromatic prenyltransferase